MSARFSKEMDKLDNGIVNKYYDVVKMSGEDTKRRVAKVMPIIQEVLQYINSRDSRFSKQPVCIGSYWQGLKIEKADEFDINVVVMGCPDLVPASGENKCIGFNKNVDDPVRALSDDLKIVKKSSPLPSPPPGHQYIHLDGCGMSDWIVDGVLIPFLVKRAFHHLLVEAIRKLGLRGKARLSKMVAGPALTVRVMDEREKGGIVADVDFAPILKSVADFPVSWPKGHVEWPSHEKIQAVLEKRTSRVTRKNFCWSVSHAQADNELCRNMDADGGCRKQCLRMMKKIKSDIWCTTKKTLTSYHLKNTLWWECQERPHSWNIERVAFNFMSLVRRLHGYVKERHLPLYFDPDVNLLLEKSAEDLKEVQRNLEEFLQSPSDFIQAALAED